MALQETVIYASTRFGGRKCPPGSLAQHPQHGNVRVVGANGAVRTIEVDSSIVIETDPGDAAFGSRTRQHNSPVIEQLLVAELDVPVADLVELNPIRDLEAPVMSLVLHADFPVRKARTLDR